MAKIVEFEWTVPLTDNDNNTDMKLSISVDPPQVGSSILRKPSGQIVNGDVKNESLGTGASLHGKSLYCQTIVTDFDKNSNKTKVNFKLNGYTISYSEDVEKHGGTIMYKVTLNFR